MTDHCVLAGLLSLLAAGSLRGGLYIPGEPSDFVPSGGKVAALPFDQFRLRLGDVVGIQVLAKPSEMRKHFQARAAELESRRRRLSGTELVALGGCRYRLGELDRALDAWHEATRKDPRNFLAYSDLALLMLVRSDPLEALRYQDSARPPKELPEMTPEQSAWYLSIENKLRTFARARAREQRKTIPPAELKPDDLFGAEFVGESGAYEAGKMASALAAKLPEDAIAVVQQLVLWMPQDSRLYWLLAELYNARGEPGAALVIMKECTDARGFQPDLLREHRRVIQDEMDRRQEEAGRRQEAKQREAERQQEEVDRQERQKRHVLWGVGLAGAAVIVALVLWQVRIYAAKLRRPPS